MGRNTLDQTFQGRNHRITPFILYWLPFTVSLLPQDFEPKPEAGGSGLVLASGSHYIYRYKTNGSNKKKILRKHA